MYILGDIGNSETKVYLVNSKNKIIKNIKFSSKKINNKIISMINKICRFWSVKGINPSLMKVKNVTIPKKIHKNEDKIIQLKFFIILNIPNKR